MRELELGDVTKRLEEVNKIITKLAPEIRNSAFELFESYVISGNSASVATAREDAEPPADMAVLERLITEHGTSKPSGNVHLLAADWYSEYGSSRFTVDTIKKRADAAGLTIPARTDMTLRAAMENGKKLFQIDGDGFKPTVPGEMYLKETFKVKKGIKTPFSPEGA